MFYSFVILLFFLCESHATENFTEICSYQDRRFCVSVSMKPASFRDAEHRCQAVGRNLITIKSLEDQRFIIGILSNSTHSAENLWFGLYASYGGYRWVSGDEAVPNIFLAPSQTFTPDKCIAVGVSQTDVTDPYTWKIVPCDAKLNFICGSKTDILQDERSPARRTMFCPSRFHYVDGSCFQVSLLQSSWAQAKKICSQLHPNATLASITSLEQQDFVTILLSQTFGSAWIGLSLSQNEHRWQRNDSMSFTNWMPGQPESGKNTLCTAVLRRPHHRGQWEDSNCSVALSQICQAPALSIQPSSPVVPLISRGQCQEGFWEFDLRCYRLVRQMASQTNKLPKNECPMHVAPHTLSEAAFMRTLLRNNPELQSTGGAVGRAWVGLSFTYNPALNPVMNFTVDDGIRDVLPPTVYEKFAFLVTRENGNKSFQVCAALTHNETDMQWISCETILPSICGYNLNGYNLHPNASATCPPNWTQLGNKCYSPIRNTPATWMEAESACLDMNSTLISVHSPTEHQFIGNYLRFRGVWLGLRMNQNPSSKYLYWSDDSPTDYVSFAAGQPSMESSDGAIESCAVLAEHTHDWRMTRCDDLHSFVCQITIVLPAGSERMQYLPIAAPKEVCSDTIKPGYCVEFYARPDTFVHAEEMCRSRNKTLATIPSEEHQKFLMATLQKIPGFYKAYIGLFIPEATLMWVSNYPSIPVTFWTHTAPSGTEQCIYVRNDNQTLDTWEAVPCTESLPFVCSSPVPIQTASAMPFNQQACPEPYIHIGSSCFFIKADHLTAFNRSEATKLCAQLQPNGRLASIHSIREQDGLSVLLASMTSIPAWIGLHSDNHGYKWQNGVEVNFTNWAPGYPKSGTNRCVRMSTSLQDAGQWTDSVCSSHAGYICETDPIAVTQTSKTDKIIQQLNRGSCVPGYYQFEGRCYGLSNQNEIRTRSSKFLHDDVSASCLTSMHFTGFNCTSRANSWGTSSCPVAATPHTTVDAAFMRLLLNVFGTGSTSAWIGLKLRSNSSTHTLLSEDESVVGASNLVAYESLPTVFHATQPDVSLNCLIATALDTRLRFTPCETKGLPTLCSYDPAKQINRIQPTVPSMTTCPTGWILVNGLCYLPAPIGIRSTWMEAEQACQDATRQIPVGPGLIYAGHLASLHSVEQQNRLSAHLRATSTWFGLRMLAIHPDNSIHFSWSDTSPVDYLGFSVEQLRVVQPQSSCLTVDDSGASWTPVECLQRRSYICQLTAVRQSDSTRTALVSTKNTPSCSTEQFPLSVRSSNACYHVAPYVGSWVAAEDYCRSLNPEAHLASIHSETQMLEIEKLLFEGLPVDSEIWFGLHENEFAYAWSDLTPVNFVSLSADLSKENRHLSEDCFILKRDSNPVASPSYLWVAVDCSSRRSGVLCQLSPVPQVQSPSMNDDPTGWNFVPCPQGYRQFANRCFSVTPQLMSWNDANQFCAKTVSSLGFSGSLVTIDSGLVQEFVASLLGDLPLGSTSAWIGLTRVVSAVAPKLQWADRSTVRYLRSVYRSHEVSTFGNRISMDNEDGLELCSVLYRSSYPRVNGLWLQLRCDLPVLLPSVCQAVPSAQTQNGTYRRPTQFCPPGFYIGTTGTVSSSALSKPMCYRLLDPWRKMNWQDAMIGCRKLTTKDYNVSALSIASVFEASFLRAWLHLPRSLGGAELTSTEPVWSGLRVTHQCPQCLYNWTWNSSEPVRYTDWFIPPTPSPGGCYVFHSNPYYRDDLMSINGLGSLRPESTCDAVHYAVCQTVAITTSTSSQPSTMRTPELFSRFSGSCRLPSRPACFSLDETNSKSEMYRSDVVRSVSNKSCIRWDLVPANLSNYHMTSDWIRHRISAATAVGSDGTPSYAENYCSLVFNTTTKRTVFGCYVGLKPIQFEHCQLQTCDNAIASSTHWVVWVFLILLCIGVCVLGVSLWRGCTPLRLGYRRHFTPSLRSTRFSHGGAVRFMASDESSSTGPNGVNAHTSPGIGIPLSNGSDKGQSKLLHTDSEPGGHSLGDQDHGIVQFAKIAKLGGYPAAYHNPIYTTLPEIAPEDEYDPEA